MIADLIYNLQNNPKSKFPGYCYATRDKLGDLLGISRVGIQKIIGRLKKDKLIEVDPLNHYMKTTQEWYEKVVYIHTNEEPVNKVYTSCKQSIQPVYTKFTPKPDYDNKSDNNTDISSAKEPTKVGITVVKVDSKPAEISRTIGYIEKISDLEIDSLIEKFPVMTKETITREASRAVAWLDANGKTQKNYKSFFRNWVDNAAERLEKQKGGGYGPRVSVQE